MSEPRLLRTLADLEQAHAARPVVLVPTMGAIHAGHLALVEQARRLAEAVDGLVCVSIFVNPLQFGPNEDFNEYPRTLDADVAKLAALADTCFVPTSSEIYPEQQEIFLQAPELGQQLCGVSRPHFFSGVLTVVNKLFALVKPHTAIFGEKDYQQLVLIRKMVTQLHLPVVIEAATIVREDDGLAYSSRNSLLTAEQRKLAPQLYASLQTAVGKIAAGDPVTDVLAAEINQLTTVGMAVDYLECREQDTLANWQPGTEKNFIVLGAVKLGNVRLIDNLAN